jgi:hypothetical protein
MENSSLSECVAEPAPANAVHHRSGGVLIDNAVMAIFADGSSANVSVLWPLMKQCVRISALAWLPVG